MPARSSRTAARTIFRRWSGLGRALEFAYTGELNAERAYQWGMLNHLVPSEKLEETTRELCARMIARPAAGAVGQQARHARRAGQHAGDHDGADLQRRRHPADSDDAKEARRAFVEKRKGRSRAYDGATRRPESFRSQPCIGTSSMTVTGSIQSNIWIKCGVLIRWVIVRRNAKSCPNTGWPTGPLVRGRGKGSPSINLPCTCGAPNNKKEAPAFQQGLRRIVGPCSLTPATAISAVGIVFEVGKAL